MNKRNNDNNNNGYLQNFIPIQQASQKLRFALFRNIFYEVNMPYLGSFGTTYAKLIGFIFQSFFKDILLSKI